MVDKNYIRRTRIYETVVYINNYFNETGIRCFTYRRLRSWWDKKQLWKKSEWHTVERNIRLLAQYGYLTRIKKKKYVIFCVNDKFFDLLV